MTDDAISRAIEPETGRPMPPLPDRQDYPSTSRLVARLEHHAGHAAGDYAYRVARWYSAAMCEPEHHQEPTEPADLSPTSAASIRRAILSSLHLDHSLEAIEYTPPCAYACPIRP